MKVLFLLSTNIWFDHLSGEQEARALNLGFLLLGIQCDFVGIDAEDFGEYDVYVVFSMSPDIQEKIKFIEPHKKVIVIPQTENYSDVTLERLTESSLTVSDFYVVARNELEAKFFSRACPEPNIIRSWGWFVEPFVWNEDTNCDDFLSRSAPDYILSFVGDDLDEQAVSFFEKVVPKNKRVVVSSQRCLEKYFNNSIGGTLEHRKLIKYGSAEWFCLLSKAKYYFEPNSRLTSAMLEFFWLGGEVVSPNYQLMNSMLGMPLVVSREGDLSGVSRRQKRDCIAQFRVERVAQNIVRKLSEKSS